RRAIASAHRPRVCGTRTGEDRGNGGNMARKRARATAGRRKRAMRPHVGPLPPEVRAFLPDPKIQDFVAAIAATSEEQFSESGPVWAAVKEALAPSEPDRAFRLAIGDAIVSYWLSLSAASQGGRRHVRPDRVHKRIRDIARAGATLRGLL